MDKDCNIVQEYRSIRGEYAFNPDIMCQDSERASIIKEIIDTRLSVPDKTIIILYAELQSYRKLGKEFNLSHMTIRREVMRIRGIILKEYESIVGTDNGGTRHNLHR